jgi:iron complex outermembrane recepter protein
MPKYRLLPLVRIDRYAGSNPHQKNMGWRNLKLKICASVMAAFCASLILGTTIAAQPAEARSVTYDLDIPSENLNDALQAFALVSQHKLLYSSELVNGKTSPALRGRFTTEQAVSTLLSETKLKYELTSDGLVLIRGAEATSSTSVQTPTAAEPQSKEGKRASQDFRVAQVDQGQNSHDLPLGNNPPGATDSARRSDLAEIIVTAEKRDERVQDVPVPVSVLNADTLATSDLTRLQDYFSQVPGLILTPGVQSSQTLTIRGISTGNGNPTVGVMVDDLPFGSSTALGGSGLVPDIDPGDLARIEVLRGPQGTLYGASSMGGLLKYVTVDPSTEGFTGRVQAGTDGVVNGEGLGYNVRASLNVPLSDSLALRVSGFYRRDPGYIDNLGYNENLVDRLNGVNQADVDGGRLSLLWRPSQNISVKLSALYQESKGEGSSDVIQSLGDLQQNYLPGAGGYDRKAQAYGATVNATLGTFHLTSITGYSINQFSDSLDYSWAFGAPTLLTENNRTSKLTQEFRLTTPIGDKAEWLLGAFYTHETSPYVQDLWTADGATGALQGFIEGISFPTTFQEYAAFTDLTYHFTDQFDVQFGGRESRIRQSAGETLTGASGNVDRCLYVPCDSAIQVFVGSHDLCTASFRLPGWRDQRGARSTTDL